MALIGKTTYEDQLLEKAIHGDRMGLDYLVETYKNMAYTIALKIVANREDAEEVVQDSFMKAFASLHKFNKASKFSTWLYRIVYNTALTKRKTQRAITVCINTSTENELVMLQDDLPWDMLRNQERKRYVKLAISQLTPDDQLVITLYYMGDKSIAEIGEIVDKKKSAIKMQLLRARKQLEEALEGMLDTEIKGLL